MKITKKVIYKNTARYDVSNFVRTFQPTPLESLYLDKILLKNSLSMRDFKVFLEFIAHKAAKKPVNSQQLEALGLPILPTSFDETISISSIGENA